MVHTWDSRLAALNRRSVRGCWVSTVNKTTLPCCSCTWIHQPAATSCGNYLHGLFIVSFNHSPIQMWAIAGWLVWNLLETAVINLNCVLCRSPKDMNLSQKRTPKWSRSWSSTFMTTGRATASPFPPWWSKLFSSWWGDLIQQHTETDQICLHLMTKATAQMCYSVIMSALTSPTALSRHYSFQYHYTPLGSVFSMEKWPFSFQVQI